MVVRLRKGIANIAAFETGVEILAGLRNGRWITLQILNLPRESHENAKWIVLLRDVGSYGFLPAHGFFPARLRTH